MRKCRNVAWISVNKIGKMRKEEAPSFPHVSLLHSSFYRKRLPQQNGDR